MNKANREFEVGTNSVGLSPGAKNVARGLRRASLVPEKVAGTAVSLDMAALTLGLWIARYISGGATFQPGPQALLSLAGALSLVVMAWTIGEYRLHLLRRRWRGTAILLLPSIVLALIADGGVYGLLILSLLIIASRTLGSALAAAVLDFGLTERRAVIIGGGENGARLVADLASTPDNDIRVCGIFDDRDDSRSPPVVDGIPKLGTMESLIEFARTAELDMLIVTLPLSAERRIRDILKAVDVLPLDVRLSSFSTDQAFRRRAGRYGEGGLIEVISRPLRYGELAMKRALDLVGASIAIVMLAPLLAVTALAIRLDTSGPILFRQPRHGYNHRPIEVWKFRSMRASDCDPAARHIVTRDDPRVTRVGRFIRRWSIDELPQLFNVLAGDLSLVGPRPHAVAAVSSRRESFEAIVQGYAARHKVRPGMTGWAQIHGWRGEIDDPAALKARVEHDLYYIENWSLRLDLYILAITPFRLLDKRRAY